MSKTRINKRDKYIVLYPEDQGQFEPCPECGELFQANGTGPSNKPELSKLLQSLPTEKYLGGLPPAFHDYAYLLCPAGWTVALAVGCGVLFIANDRRSADNEFRLLMLWQVDQLLRGELDTWNPVKKATALIKRTMLRHAAELYYKAVVSAGDSSYKHVHK